MNGRNPMMWVTVLQSQPSVSMATLTMQRTSRPGGWRGLFRKLACVPTWGRKSVLASGWSYVRGSGAVGPFFWPGLRVAIADGRVSHNGCTLLGHIDNARC
jgi:hypothetical protein